MNPKVLKAGKIGGFAVASLLLTTVVAQFTGACPGLIGKAPALVTACVGAGVAYAIRKPLQNAGLKAFATGALGAVFAALVESVKSICGTSFLDQVPTLVAVGVCIAAGHYLQSPVMPPLPAPGPPAATQPPPDPVPAPPPPRPPIHIG